MTWVSERKKAKWYHLIALVLIAALGGGAIGYVTAGVVFDPVAYRLHDTIRQQRIRASRQIFETFGVHSARGGFLLGAAVGALSLTAFLVRIKLQEHAGEEPGAAKNGRPPSSPSQQ